MADTGTGWRAECIAQYDSMRSSSTASKSLPSVTIGSSYFSPVAATMESSELRFGFASLARLARWSSRRAGFPSRGAIDLLVMRVLYARWFECQVVHSGRMYSVECRCRQRFISATVTERARTIPTPIKRSPASNGVARSMEARNRMTGSYRRPTNDRTIPTHPGSERSRKRPARAERRSSPDREERL